MADRAAAYGIPGVIVDGQDAEAVYETLTAAVDDARAGKARRWSKPKPTATKAIRAPTRRPIVPTGELDQWLARDPINILADRMKADGQLTDASSSRCSSRRRTRVQDATTWALEQPYPPLEAVYEDIWV